MRRSLTAALLAAVALSTPASADPIDLSAVRDIVGECMDCFPMQIVCVSRPCDWLDPGTLLDLPPL